MLEPLATLATSTTRIEVIDCSWNPPVEAKFAVEQPTITLVMPRPQAAQVATYHCSNTMQVHAVGGVVFVPSACEVTGRADRGGRVTMVTCSFEPKAYDELVRGLPRLAQSRLAEPSIVHSQLAPALLSRMMSEVMQPSSMRQELADALGRSLLVECWHAVQTQEEHVTRGRLTPRQLSIIDEYLAGLRYEAPSVSAIARACGLSARHLARLFREQTNMSLGQYLKAVQISKAQTFLLESDLSLKEIAYRLGFSAPSNFCAAFRAATGHTPTQFRRINRDYAHKDVTVSAMKLASATHASLSREQTT